MKRIFYGAMLIATSLFAACGGADDTGKTSKAAATTAALPPTDTASGKIAYVCPPCPCPLHDTIFYHPGLCPACHMPLVRKK